MIGGRQGHVDAQLMARDRTRGPVVPRAPALRDPNNSAASDGFDVSFGTYVIDAAAGIVRHQLPGRCLQPMWVAPSSVTFCCAATRC
ncbi:MAG: hypothetical protein P3C10_10410 [Gemmatimonadota bacterium]|nr:hypothetical protein [Gemmatimonadota bacterium]